MTFAGLDLSYAGTGVVVYDGSRVIDHRLIGTPAELDKWHRIHVIRIGVRKMMREWGVDRAAVEGYSYGDHRSAMSSELGGVVRYDLWLLEIPFLEPTPTEIKKWATDDGRASKEDMLSAARELWADCPDDHNLADAFLLALYAHSTA